VLWGGRYDRGIVTAVTARVPAKVNLQLSVGPPGADGYHDLVTVFHALALFDEVTVTSADTDSVVVSGEGARSVPLGPDNLAARAVTALVDAVGPGVRDAPGVAIEIRKRIPVAAGLAGGSADAAGALVGCNELWGTGLSHQELVEVAAKLGSDVGFALLGGTAVGLGRGDRVTPALAAGTYHWVLAFASEQLSTPAVYAACDRLRAGRSGQPDPGGEADPPGPPQPNTALMAALRSGDPAELGPLLSNDLQPAAVSLLPRLRQALAAGREHGALGAIVSGSGPTCAFLARDGARARDLAVAMAGAGVCRTVATVTGPAPGATVISVPAAGGPGGRLSGPEAGRPLGRP
jgi:4-diphosphocytidyl-2-C-methyl-D-erythritol kinase